MSAKTESNTAVEVLDRVKMQPPKMWNVIFYNDEVTTCEFVVLVLMQIFHKSFEDASDIMMNIHENNRGIAGTYSHEVASQKRDETINAARSNNFPLRVEIEPVE